VTTNASKHLYEALLIGAGARHHVVAALTAWAAQLGEGAWLAVLVPFGPVLVVPLVTLAWLRTDQSLEGPSKRPAALPKNPLPV
jgi:uncharacterized membrane protein